MEHETGGGERGQWTPSFISLNGWVVWDRKMETMMDSATARKVVDCDVRPLRNRILDMHRTGMTGWPEKLKVQVEVNPRRKPHVIEMGRLLMWLKKINVTEYVKVEWVSPCSTAKIERTGDVITTLRTSTGWKIGEKILQGLVPGMSVSAERLKNDLEDMG